MSRRKLFAYAISVIGVLIIAQLVLPFRSANTITASPFSEPDSSPAVSPQAVPVVLSEDFEDGQEQGWSHSGGGTVSIEDDAGNKVYNLEGAMQGWQPESATTFYEPSADWSDYEVDFDIKLHELNSVSLFIFRFSDWDNNYQLAIRTGYGSWGYGGRFELYQYVNGKVVNDMNGPYSGWIVAPVKVGQWHHVKVYAVGDRIQLYFDGELRFDRTGALLRRGKIGFATRPWAGEPPESMGHIYVDNIRVLAVPLAVPYYSQYGALWCVPASMAMIMKYYGRNVHPYDIVDLYAVGRDGRRQGTATSLLPWDVHMYFLSEGLGVAALTLAAPPYKVDLNAIKRWLDSGWPVMLVIGAIDHAVVIVGYIEDGDATTVFVNDPSGVLLMRMPGRIYQSPYVAEQVPWSDIQGMLGGGSWALAVKGQRSFARGTIDVVDYSVRVGHEFNGLLHGYQVFSWLRGYDRLGGGRGLDWAHSPNHPVALDPEDTLRFGAVVTNHTMIQQEYQLDVNFSRNGVLVWSRSYALSGEHAVEAYSTAFPTLEPLRIGDILQEEGKYTLSLAL